MSTPRKVHLIDALPYVFRAYFSLPTSMVDPSGRSINAVRGFGDFLLRYIADEAPTHVGLCFDKSLTTSFRNEIYPPYKSSRELPPPELEAQLNACFALGDALGLSCYEDERYEADDIIATLAAPLVGAGHECVVVTNDKDLCQLVGPRLRVYDFARGERHDEAGVLDKMGVRAGQVPDFLGLAGDSVDDIPGVKGIGVKTAAALLAEFEHLEELYEDLEKVTTLPIRGAKGVAKKLHDDREMAFLSRQLAIVATDAPVSGGLRALKRRAPDRPSLEPLLGELGLQGMLRRIDALPAPGR